EAGLQRFLERAGPGRRAELLRPAGAAATELDAPQQVARSGKVLPAGQHLALEQSAVSGLFVDLLQAGGVAILDRLPKGAPERKLLQDRTGARRPPPAERAETTGHRLGQPRAPPVVLPGGVRQPGPDRVSDR